MTVFYISPKGSGSHNGSSIKNAGTINDLSKIIERAGPGDEVRLLADKGAYNVKKQITITDGGKSGAPITIRGVSSSGNPMKATFVGTRASDWKPGRAQGNELFRLKNGANHLTFTDLSMKNFGNGVFRLGGNLDNITIKRVSANNVTRFIENTASSSRTASVNRLTVEEVTVSGYSRNAIRLQYNTQNVTLKDIVGDSKKQSGGMYIHGVNLRGTVHNVVLDHVTMKNNFGRGSSRQYWNGDGFVAEGGVHNLTFRETFASGNTDAGYDIKADNVRMIRARAEGNTKNFRFWGDNVTVEDSVSINPKKFGGTGATAHFHTGGNSATVTLDNFRYSGSAKVFDLANGGSRIRLVNMSMPDNDRIKMGSSKVQMVKGGASHSVKETSRGDALTGGTGTDISVGANGNDTYWVDHKGDRPRERAGDGTDLVRTNLKSYTLGDNLENLAYVGTGRFTGNGNSLNNTITGGARNDRLNGKDGNDRLIGGAGKDTLTGGEGSDAYVYNRGGGKDTINNRDSGGADSLVFGSGISEDQLWFGKTGSDLLVTLRGTGNSDGVRVKGWYSNSSNRLSSFELSDGSELPASNVQQMVQAMGSFSTKSGAPTNLNTKQEQTVEAVIAANWKSA